MGRLDCSGACRRHQLPGTACTGQQDADLLEGLADRGDAERQRVGIEIGRTAGAARLCGKRMVAGIDPSARKHQRAGSKIDRVVADHHEHFEPGGSIAQQQHRGCRSSRDRF